MNELQANPSPSLPLDLQEFSTFTVYFDLVKSLMKGSRKFSPGSNKDRNTHSCLLEQCVPDDQSVNNSRHPNTHLIHRVK